MAKLFSFIVVSMLIFISSKAIANASDLNFRYRHFDIESGLIHNQVEYLLVDKAGFIWIATYNGLQQFNGYEFRNYLNDPNDSSSISDNFITTLFEDKNENLFVGTIDQGINLFDRETETFLHFKNNPSSSNSILDNNSSRGKKVIAQDTEGRIWVKTSKGLNKINLENKSVERFYGDFDGQIMLDKDENSLWIAGRRLTKLNIDNGALEYFDIEVPNRPNLGNVTSFIQDKEGNIWVGTDLGVAIFEKHSASFCTLDEYLASDCSSTRTNAPKGIATRNNQSVNAIYEDYSGSIWLAVGKTIQIVNAREKTISVLTHEVESRHSPLDKNITGIYGNQKGVIWITYLSGGVSKVLIDLKNFRTFKHIPDLDNSLSGKTVRSIYKDKYDNIWIGTYNSGLNKYSESQKLFKHYKFNSLDEHSIVSNYVTSIFMDSNDRLWVGTFNNGCCYADFSPVNDKLEFKKTTVQHLEVSQFTEDSANRIWISTQRGFFIFTNDETGLIHYGIGENQIKELEEINIQSVV